MKIRKAAATDLPRLNDLLYQVAKLHAEGRPDIFKSAAKKYSDEELIAIVEGDTTPVFVACDETDRVLGYAFCVVQNVKDHLLLQDKKTLYLDDLCVDEKARGAHIGKSLYEYVCRYAKENGFFNLTLNVWAFNESAYRFYKSCGMSELKIVMEKVL